MKCFKIIISLAAFWGSIPLISTEAPPHKKAKKRREENLVNIFCKAARGGDLSTINMLLAAGIPVDARDSEGCTAFFRAAANGRLNVVERLLQAGANRNERNGLHGLTALQIAEQVGRRELVKFLLKSEADKTATSKSPVIPAAALRTVLLGTAIDKKLLDSAAVGNVQEVLNALDAGAELDTVDGKGMTALHYAAFNNRADVVKILLAAGADPNAKNEDGNTPLHYAAIQASYTPEENEQIIELLLKAGAHLNAGTSRQGTTPLHYAAAHNRPHVVRALLQAGADVNRENHCGTPLHIAAHYGHVDIVTSLLRAGAHKDTVAKDGSTPLSIAQTKGHAAIALLLKLAGAKVPAEIQDDARTPAIPEMDAHDLPLRITRINQDHAQQANGDEPARETQHQLPHGPQLSGRKRIYLDDGSN
jgi:cytohesin